MLILLSWTQILSSELYSQTPRRDTRSTKFSLYINVSVFYEIVNFDVLIEVTITRQFSLV
jgi:hypothetical protein